MDTGIPNEVTLSLPSGEQRRVPLGEALAGAVDLMQRGRNDLAEAICQQILAQHAGHGEALLLLGTALSRQQQHAQALEILQQASERQPGSADVWNNLAFVAMQLQQFDLAEQASRKAIALEPGLAMAHNNLGSALMYQRNYAEAAEAFAAALQGNPEYAAAHSNLAECLTRLGDTERARQHAERAITLNPTDPDALMQLASVNDAQQRIDEAVSIYRNAIKLAPQRADLWHNLGLLLERQGEWLAAVDCHGQAISLDPDNGPAISNLIFLKRNLCLWDDYHVDQERFDAGIERGLFGLAPLTYLAMVDDPQQQQRCARLWASHLPPTDSPSPQPSENRCRIGYLSADFHEHPTARLMAGVFEQHDHDLVHSIAYSIGRDDGSALRQRMVDSFHTFHDLRQASDAQIIEQIRRDRIDILVDLKGYTGEARTEIMAARPAPLQVQYLGYPGTMGARFIDYAVVDDYIVPEDQGAHFDEALIRLPFSYQCNDDRRETPGVLSSRADCGLPEDAVVFCCFSKPFKISPSVFAAWCQILNQVDNSVLWMLAPRAGMGIEERLREHAAAQGVDPNRLVFASRRPYLEYLDLYRHADLFLDTTPYSAHTMTSDALWMGCPVLALRGRSFAARVAAGLVSASGLEQLVTTDLADYVEKAVALGRDPAQLKAIRQQLEQQRTSNPVFQTARFTRAFEAGLLQALDRQRAGQPPGDINVDV